ncbi:MAG: DUF1223 domain-containing protein [Candidatus Thiodiazotropha sp. (ex Gloverina cf. vestifex)]|nr:DUF1223 domain-containing protein [Candidatus Thiodiazotropha sp. (ex Gloverina cf. vestifex)]
MCLTFSVMAAEPLRFESPTERVNVIELFTSHGCSSCPPADAWLSRFTDNPDLWRQVVPLAFHVDYWDYLGWQDRFASSSFSQRQRDYRQAGGLGSVYTPGVLVNGEEWRGWYRGRALPSASSEEVGRLTLSVEPDRHAVIEFSPEHDRSTAGLRANLAVLGIGIKSDIGAGENRGRSLEEDFIVLGHAATSSLTAQNTWQLAWPSLKKNSAIRYAVVAWLSYDDNPAPLQATGGWLP